MAYKRFLLSVPGGSTFTFSDLEGGGTDYEMTLGAGPWYALGDGSAQDLFLEMKTVIEIETAGGSADTYTFTWTDATSTAAAVLQVVCSGSFDLSSGTFDLSEIGLTPKGVTNGTVMDSSGFLPLVWHPSSETREWEPRPNRKGSQKRTVSNAVWNYVRTAVAQDRRIGWEFMTRARFYKDEGGDESLEAFWERSGAGRKFKVYEDTTDQGTYQFKDIEEFQGGRFSPGVPLYSATMDLIEDL